MFFIERSELGYHKRKQESKKERKHTFDQENKTNNCQEKAKENTLSTKKVKFKKKK